jgi:N-dimethylarginine dimethylaminohydrolase
MGMQLLMCPPAYYGIEYEINPWMKCSRPSNYQLAQQQWDALYQILSDQLGLQVSLLEPRPGLPDMVFTANAGFVWDNKFIPSNFRHDARRGEVTYFQEWFTSRNYEIVKLPEHHYFEGEGDLLVCADIVFAGYPYRSSASAHRGVAEIIQRKVQSVGLIRHWFYHLDTCFCPLSATEAIYYPAAFYSDALEILKEYIETLIPVTEDEARRFACNAIVIGKNVIINHGCPQICRRLESLEFSVFETPLTEFIKAGGSAKCLVLKIPHLDNAPPSSQNRLPAA